MKLIIDLQAAQNNSSFRGIGRYSLSLAKAMIVEAKRRGHQVNVLLSGLFPEMIPVVEHELQYVLNIQKDILIWKGLSPAYASDTNNNKAIGINKVLLEFFLKQHQPDFYHVASLFDGFDDNTMSIVPSAKLGIRTAVTFYDLIPYIESDIYLKPNKRYSNFYLNKVDELKTADCFLAISDSSKQELMRYLSCPEEKIANIGAGASQIFKVKQYSSAQVKTYNSKFKITKDFILYFGASDERKNHFRLIEAYNLLPISIRKKYQLVLAGGMPEQNLKKFKAYAEFCGLQETEVIFTGYVSDDELVYIYNQCSLFCFPSWHEGFGLPILEAMLCGAPVIGSNTTSVPEVIGRVDCLFDPFNSHSISQKIEEVLTNKRLLSELSTYSLNRAQLFTWQRAAKISLDKMEDILNNSISSGDKDNAVKIDVSRKLFFSDVIKNLVSDNFSSPIQLPNYKQVMSYYDDFVGERTGSRKFYVDVTELVKHDAATGIQRVTRNLLKAYIENPPAGYDVLPVYFESAAQKFIVGNQYLAKILSQKSKNIDTDLDIKSGDIFCGIDLNFNLSQGGYIDAFKAKGAEVYIVVYDLLPLLLAPRYFAPGMADIYFQWIKAISRATGLMCISKAVADELLAALPAIGDQAYKRPLIVDYFPLGADFKEVKQVVSRTFAENIRQKLSGRRSFIMVGTIEPRKGHMQVLAAFDRLWHAGVDANLIIVGKNGWNMDLFNSLIHVHREYNKRLFWFDKLNDAELQEVYRQSDCLIAASEGEGYGLPIIEAAFFKKPVIARDIPVFREVAGQSALYFSNKDSVNSLFSNLNKFLVESAHQNLQDVSIHSWQSAAEILLSKIKGEQHYATYCAQENVLAIPAGDGRIGSQIGERTPLSIFSIPKKTGYLVFGPYIDLTPGLYEIKLKGNITKEPQKPVLLDICINRGAKVMSRFKLTKSSNGIIFIDKFIVKATLSGVELRVLIPEGCDVDMSIESMTFSLLEDSVQRRAIRI